MGSGTKLFDRRVLHQVPYAARTGAGAKTASDAQVLINDIFVRAISQILFADRRLGTDGNAYATVPAGAAG